MFPILKRNTVVIITGMHRSGTSLLASLMESSGVNIGDNLVKANTPNIYGYFEDIDFMNFQNDILKRSGLACITDSGNSLSIHKEDHNIAKHLIEKRSKIKIWGWKDPRTCIFLDFWKSHIPNAKFLFVYRHPLEVLLSLLYRSDKEIVEDPISGLNSWLFYNKKIIAHIKQNTKNSYLFNIHGLLKEEDYFNTFIKKKLKLKKDIDFALYRDASLNNLKIPEYVSSLLNYKFPDVMECYNELQKFSVLPYQNIQKCNVLDQDDERFVEYLFGALKSVYDLKKA